MKIGEIELLDASAFFVKSIDAPTGMSEADTEAFIETTLEDVCPLPPEKIRKGWFLKGENATVFASQKEKIESAIVADFGSEIPDYAVPCASLLLFAPLPDCRFFFADESAVCAVDIKNGAWTNFLVQNIESGNFKDALAELSKICGEKSPAKSVFKLKKFDGKKYATALLSPLDEDGNFSKNSTDDDIEFSFSLKKLATLDLRDRKELKRMNADARKEKIERRLLIATPVAFAILLLAQIVVSIWGLSTTSKNARVSALEKTSKEVEKQSEQIAEILKFEGDKLHPLTTVAYLNFLRPDGISYSKVSVNGLHEVEIQGKSQSIKLLDSYVRNLKNDANIRDVKVDSRSARSEAQFTIKLNIKKPL